MVKKPFSIRGVFRQYESSKGSNIPNDSVIAEESFQGPVTAISCEYVTSFKDYSTTSDGKVACEPQFLQVVHVARGPYVSSFQWDGDGEFSCVFSGLKVFDHHVHGISDGGEKGLLVWGDWQFAMIPNVNAFQHYIKREAELPSDQVWASQKTSDWILDGKLVLNKKEKQFLGGIRNDYFIVLGFANHYVEIWCDHMHHNDNLHGKYNFQSKMRISGCVPSLLYSCAITCNKRDELVVASGTVFQQIMIWKNDLNCFEDCEKSKEETSILSGHRGVIFSCRWSHDASVLVTCSDDRSVRVWTEKEQVGDVGFPMVKDVDPAARGWVCRLELVGHKARVWDAQLVRRAAVKAGALGEWVIVSVSEDSSCRVWCAKTGKCTLKGFFSALVVAVGRESAVTSEERLLRCHTEMVQNQKDMIEFMSGFVTQMGQAPEQRSPQFPDKVEIAANSEAHGFSNRSPRRYVAWFQFFYFSGFYLVRKLGERVFGPAISTVQSQELE